MALPYVCCDPCEEVGLCSKNRNCCLECHFSAEEELALPYLPAHLRERIVQEHRLLEALGFPKDGVEAHARWEEYVFRVYCPESVCRRMAEDHHAYDEGQLVSRVRGRAPNPDPGILRMQRVRGRLPG